MVMGVARACVSSIARKLRGKSTMPLQWLGLATLVAAAPSITYLRGSTNIGSLESKRVTTSGVDSKWVKQLGITDSLEACGSLCMRYGDETSPCRSFTRFNERYAKNVSLAGMCFGHVDHTFVPMAVDGVDTGRISWPWCRPSSNVFKKRCNLRNWPSFDL